MQGIGSSNAWFRQSCDNVPEMNVQRGVLMVVLLTAVGLSGQDYFPAGALSRYAQVDTARARWYSGLLTALDEPSLLQTSKNPALQSYRFVWLRTFHHPVAVRLDVMGDGTGMLTVKHRKWHGWLQTRQA